MSFRGRSQWLHTWFHLESKQDASKLRDSRITEHTVHTKGEEALLAVPPGRATLPTKTPDL